MAILAAVTIGAAFAPMAHAAGFGAGAQVERKADNNRVRFVAGERGRALERPKGFSASSDPRDVGRAFLNGHARDFGLHGKSSLRVLRVADEPRGGAAVRYQQLIDGVPVLAGEFNVRLDAENRVLSVQGEADPVSSVDTDPSVAAAAAERIAVAKVAKDEQVDSRDLSAETAVLRIFNDSIMGGPGADRARLVWATEVSDGLAIRRLVLVDAERGGVVASLERAPAAKNRSVCDAANSDGHLPCAAPILTEGGNAPGGSHADVQKAYDYAGATYDFFKSRFDRDSLDGAGMPLKSTVRYCDPGQDCPFGNAFWNGQQMVYGQDYASADDVVGHELAHGFTEFTSGLFYYYQSGAINESMSDIFGEFIDQVTASPNDAAGDRWKIGESLPIGAIRDMKNPPADGFSPDRMLSPLYWTDRDDSGGVHINSGVGNKTASLITDGGTFNGQTVTGIGLEKAARLYYRVETSFLTSGSDYKDLGLALEAACYGLVGTAGITDSDCTNVRKAVLASEMLSDRPETPDQAECLTGQTAQYALNETVDGAEIPWTTNNVSGDPTLVGGWTLDNVYATSGIQSFFGYDPSTATDRSVTLTPAIIVPAGGFLSFQHAYDFESGGYDGGVVEYSTNNGLNWTDTAVQSAYNGTLQSGSGNPLGGRKAFVDVSGGFRRTVVSLAALAGQNIRLRFRIASDDLIAGGGWQVDDIRVGRCETMAVPDPLVSTLAASGVTEGAAVIHGTVNPNGTATSAFFEVADNVGFSSPETVGAADLGSGTSVVPLEATIAGLAPNTKRYFRVVAKRGSTRYEGVTQEFTTLSAPTVLTQPATDITVSSAVVRGSVNPNGTATSAVFEVDDNSGFSSPETAGAADVGSGTSAVPLQATISGLQPSTTRYFRVVATRGSTRYEGATQEFTTISAAAAPIVVTGSASALTAESATVEGTITPNNLESTYHVEYGVSGFGSRTSDQTVPAGASPVAVKVALSGLAPSTPYSYRFVATNLTGTTQGAVRTFTTPAATTPTTPTTPTATPPPPATTPPVDLSPTPVPKSLTGKAKGLKLTCVNVGGKVGCNVSVTKAKRKRKVSARLTLRGVTVARGSVKKANAKGTVSIKGAASLPVGTYRLTVKVGKKTYRFSVKLR